MIGRMSSETTCPTCGKDDFKTESGMKSHHATVHGESIAGIERDCHTCESTFRQKQGNAEKNERAFCSRECYNEWWIKNIAESENSHTEVECEWCGEKAKRLKSEIRNSERVFCDIECQHAWQKQEWSDSDKFKAKRIDTTCNNCDSKIEVRSYTWQNTERQFCDADCKQEWQSEHMEGENHPAWRGGYNEYYGANWYSQRERAKERDGYQCVECGMSNEHSNEIYNQDLDVHHIVPFDEFESFEDANDLSNLVTVCRDCHTDLEKKYRSADPDREYERRLDR